MTDPVTTVILAVVGSGALSALIAGIFNVVLNRRGRLAKIEAELQTLSEKQEEGFRAVSKRLELGEKDGLRTQLLVLISDYPHETSDILKLGEHYFKTLDGNWVASNIFIEWCEKYNVPIPSWFHHDKSK